MTADGITLIDTWELPEDRIDEAVERWRERVALVHTAPGFRAARLHRRLRPETRLGLVNVARWDSVEARDRALANPAFTASAATATDYATVRGGWYRVAAEFGSQPDRSDAEPGITFVNVFEIPPDRIDGFLTDWVDRAELMSKAPGFRDSRLHRAIADDTHFQLVNVAHWDSAQAWRAAIEDPRFRQRVAAVPDFVVADPGLFRMVAGFSAAGNLVGR